MKTGPQRRRRVSFESGATPGCGVALELVFLVWFVVGTRLVFLKMRQ